MPSRLEYPRKPPTRWTDWTMLGLAVVSLVLVTWITFAPVSVAIYDTVLYLDLAICVVFAAEFGWRWRQAGWGWKFPLTNWYEIIGMIPMIVFTHPWLRAFRLVRIVVVLARLGRVVDRAFGEQITAAIVNRFAKTIVEVIKRPITVAVLDEVGAVLKAGHYTRNISAALRENQDEMDVMVVEMIRKDPQVGRLKFLPFHDDIVRLIANTVFRMLFHVLEDRRTDEIVSDLLRENIDQIRVAVRRGDHAV